MHIGSLHCTALETVGKATYFLSIHPWLSLSFSHPSIASICICLVTSGASPVFWLGLPCILWVSKFKYGNPFPCLFLWCVPSRSLTIMSGVVPFLLFWTSSYVLWLLAWYSSGQICCMFGPAHETYSYLNTYGPLLISVMPLGFITLKICVFQKP